MSSVRNFNILDEAYIRFRRWNLLVRKVLEYYPKRLIRYKVHDSFGKSRYTTAQKSWVQFYSHKACSFWIDLYWWLLCWRSLSLPRSSYMHVIIDPFVVLGFLIGFLTVRADWTSIFFESVELYVIFANIAITRECIGEIFHSAGNMDLFNV